MNSGKAGDEDETIGKRQRGMMTAGTLPPHSCSSQPWVIMPSLSVPSLSRHDCPRHSASRTFQDESPLADKDGIFLFPGPL